MKVALVSTYPPRRCGIGDFTAAYASELARASDGVEVGVLTYPDGMGAGAGAMNGVEILRDLDPRSSPRQFAALIERLAPDVVHLQSSTFLHRPSLNSAIAEGCIPPLVTTIHDTPQSWRLFYTIPSLRQVYAKSRLLIAHSLQVSQTLSEFHKIDPGRIVMIPLGVDTSRFHPTVDCEDAIRSYELEGKNIVLYFGFLRKGKGIEVLLRAWSRVKDAHPDTVLVLAGGTPTAARRSGLLLHDETAYPLQLRVLAQNLGLGESVRFTGFVPDGLVPQLLAAAAIVVLPYLGRVSQSGPLLQALSSGRPVIASRLQGFQSLIQDGRNGMLCPPGDDLALSNAMDRLLREPSLAEELGRHAREYAETNLAWPIIADRMTDLYAEAVASSPR